LGSKGKFPLTAAFLLLAFYDYSSGLRAPALVAFVKDIMIYIVVLVAIALIPLKFGGYGAVFQAAEVAFKAKGSAEFCSALANISLMPALLSVRPWPSSCTRMR
jgi:solute:Na+ symporter, SSS family